jgi:hypothetical protein
MVDGLNGALPGSFFKVSFKALFGEFLNVFMVFEGVGVVDFFPW